MPPYVRVVGTTRNGPRVGQQRISSKAAIVIDLGDPKQRQEFAHHVAIGQAVSLGSVAPHVGGGATVTGAIVIPTRGTTARGLDVSSGTIKTAAGGTQAVAATTVAFTAADATNPRIDVVQVNTTNGTVSVVAGTAAASPTVPAAATDNIALARVYVPANATSPKWVEDVRPLAAV